LPEWFAKLFEQKGAIFRYRAFTGSERGTLGDLALQAWVAVSDLAPRSPAHAAFVAKTLGLPPDHAALFADTGVILSDNARSNAASVRAVREFLVSLPPSIWDVQVITIRDFMGSPAAGIPQIVARSAVNIFGFQVGEVSEDSFSEPAFSSIVDTHLVALSHEIAHNMLDTVGRRTRPELFQRKFEILQKAAGPDVVFRQAVTDGVDWPATQARFQASGLWNASPAGWSGTLERYFAERPKLETAYPRNSMKLFLEAPQEAFATLANQYFASSRRMLDFCWSRAKRGLPTNADAFLLFLEYMSEGTNQARFYTIDARGTQSSTPVSLERDGSRRIVKIVHGGQSFGVTYGAGGFVSQVSP
jgi:hypothetical protein